MKRRAFIKSILITFIFILIINLYLYFDFDFIISRLIRQELNYMNIESDAIPRFVQDAANYKLWNKFFGNSYTIFLIKLHYLIENPWLKLPGNLKYQDHKNQIIGEFLLSTNFFYQNPDSSQQIRYQGLYDPYLRPCSNPFAIPA